MKKNILSLAVASSVAGLAVTAQAAMYLNPEGTGEVLLFPYYNAQNGNETSMHIVNTTDDAKAVKVRFMEYVNSQEVLDFNLYMSPRDHFAFTIYQDPDGTGGAIITRDNSCTVPRLGSGTGAYAGTTVANADGSTTRIQPFLPYQYDGDAYDLDERNLVGHVEVIEMGVMDPDGGREADPDLDITAFDPAAYATHDASGVPADCDALVAAWSTGGDWLADAGEEMDGPTGGLYGISNILSNMDAAAYGVEPAAIADFWAADAGEQHTDPGDVLPSLASGDDQSLIPNNGDFFTLDWDGDEIDAVSSLFMAEVIANDVMVNADLGGETDWVVTFPTRRYYVNGAAPVQPFTMVYDPEEAPNNSCVSVRIEQTDREESGTDPVINAPIFSPPPPDADPDDLPVLCYEANTIAVNGESALNASVSEGATLRAAISVDAATPEGWQTINFMATGEDANGDLTVDEHWMEANGSLDGAGAQAPGNRINGLPVIGFAAFEYTNGSKNFGFVSDHKTQVGGSGVGDVPAP